MIPYPSQQESYQCPCSIHVYGSPHHPGYLQSFRNPAVDLKPWHKVDVWDKKGAGANKSSI